jgi:glycosyltransferase involved in cell wall biosynthesis
VTPDQSIERARRPLELPADAGLDHARGTFEARDMPVAAVGHGDRFHLTERAQVVGVGDAVVVHVPDEFRQVEAPASREMEAEEPIVVHGAAVTEVEQPDSREGVAADQGGRVIQRRHAATDRVRIVRLTGIPEVRPAPSVEDDVAEDEIGAGGVEAAHGDLHLVGRQPIVGVDELDQLAGRERDPFVERIADTEVGFADPIVLRAQLGTQELDRAVVGAAVDDNMLEVGEPLRVDAVDGLPDSSACVERNRDQGDPRSLRPAQRVSTGTEAPLCRSPIVVQSWRGHDALPGCRRDMDSSNLARITSGIMTEAGPVGSHAHDLILTPSEAAVDRPPRVILVSDFGDVAGGAAKVAITSARGLAERGIEVVFVCAIGPVSPLLQHANIDVRCFDLPGVWGTRNPLAAAMQGVWNADAARRLRAVLQEEDPNETIVHFHQWTKGFSPSVIAAAGTAGFRRLISLHDYFLSCPNGTYFHFPRAMPCRLRPSSIACICANCDSRNYAFKAVRLLRHGILARALGFQEPSSLSVIHVSEFARQVAQPLLPFETRHFVVPNPVDVVKGPPVAVRDNSDFVFIGRFSREKRCVLFAQAALEAGVPAIFLGKGPEEQVLRTANPYARVLPWGSSDTVAQVLSQARALVFPSSWYETSGLVVAEALARGVPAIVGRATAARDLIRDGVNGLLCEPGSLEALVASLQRLQDDDCAAVMGANAFALYWADPLSVSAHVDRLLVAYRSTGLGVRESACGSYPMRPC